MPQYTTVIPTQSTYYKEVATTAPTSDLGSQSYRTSHVGIQYVQVPSSGNQQQVVHASPMQNHSQSVAAASVEVATNGNGLVEDPTRAQIYKSQPPPPSFPSQLT